MLRKYITNLSYVLETPPFELKEDLSFKVQPVVILDHREKVLRNKIVPIVKVLRRSDKVEDMTWETKASTRNVIRACSPIE